MSKREFRRQAFGGFAWASGRLLALSPVVMRQIKLSGREQAVIRAIDYAVGSTGKEIQARTQIDAGDVADLLGSLCEIGYVEPTPHVDVIKFTNYAELRFEVNPSYALELKEALKRR